MHPKYGTHGLNGLIKFKLGDLSSPHTWMIHLRSMPGFTVSWTIGGRCSFSSSYWDCRKVWLLEISGFFCLYNCYCLLTSACISSVSFLNILLNKWLRNGGKKILNFDSDGGLTLIFSLSFWIFMETAQVSGKRKKKRRKKRGRGVSVTFQGLLPMAVGVVISTALI